MPRLAKPSRPRFVEPSFRKQLAREKPRFVSLRLPESKWCTMTRARATCLLRSALTQQLAIRVRKCSSRRHLARQVRLMWCARAASAIRSARVYLPSRAPNRRFSRTPPQYTPHRCPRRCRLMCPQSCRQLCPRFFQRALLRRFPRLLLRSSRHPRRAPSPRLCSFATRSLPPARPQTHPTR